MSKLARFFGIFLALALFASSAGAMLGAGVPALHGTPPSGPCGSFTPANGITNIRMALRADLGVTNVSGLASAWADQSGAGDANRSPAQATAGNRPTINASDAAFNNQASLGPFTTATNIRLVTAGAWSTTYAPPYTFIVVGNVLDQTGNRYIFTQSSGFTIISLLNNGANKASITLGGGGSITSTIAGNRSINSPAVFMGEAFSSPANGAFAYINTLFDHSYDSGAINASGTLQSIGAATIAVGSFASGTANTSGGKLAEVIVASGIIPTAQKSCLQYYLNTRYNFGVSYRWRSPRVDPDAFATHAIGRAANDNAFRATGSE